MTWRFRRRFRLFPGISLNLSKNGLSSLSIGRPGATVNVPIAREGKTRGTVGLPGSGLSFSQDLEFSAPRSVRERQQAQRTAPATTTTEQLIAEVMETLCGPSHVGQALWGQGLAQRVIDHEDTPRPIREAAHLVRSPEAVELHLRRAKGKAATQRAASEVLTAIRQVLTWTESQGWSQSLD